MKLSCFLMIGILAAVGQARSDKYFGGKYHAPAATRATTRQQTTTSKTNNPQRQTSSDYKRPNSIGGGRGSDAGPKVPILRNDQEMKKDGSYHYQYETGNGISGMEQGTAGVAVKGASSYVSPEGVEIKLSYTADETGYHPVGDHIPKTPDYVFRALEYIRTHPFKVIKASDLRPRLSTVIAPPLQTPSNPRNLNYKSSSFNSKSKSATSKSQSQRNARRNNNLRRRF
ncbi:pupal cuticle protein 27 [Zeugodacus cucurbitae]|uniref:pupal cuticle protein 27 n=1 Tax=Zeugodacus cucurbitae TaxID=28588 RepID=UPI0023D92892|nr:pupal cuticle protein 27 [Zeugodacus cucurbitae]